VRVALCQLLVGTDKQVNLHQAAASVHDAKCKGAQIVVLPEMFNCPYSNDSFPTYSEPIPTSSTTVDAKLHPSTYQLVHMAKSNGILLIGGSIPERDASGKLYNTCLVIDAAGNIIAKHRKIHLFDIDVPGKIKFKESDTLTAGSSVTVVDTAYGRIGIGICYDIRFVEYALTCAAQGAQLLVYPGAFNTITGPAHWELLIRARAVDTQSYVLACSPARNPASTYQAWGHSTVVGPWADVLATTEHQPALVIADLDLNRIGEVRNSIPIRRQKRYALYQIQPVA